MRRLLCRSACQGEKPWLRLASRIRPHLKATHHADTHEIGSYVPRHRLSLVFGVCLLTVLSAETGLAAKHKSSRKAPAATTSPPASQPADPAELERLRSRIDALSKNLEGEEASRVEAADSLKESERAISEANRGLLGLS